MSRQPKPAKTNEVPQDPSTSKGEKGQNAEGQQGRDSDIPFNLPRRMSCLDLTKGCAQEERKSNDSGQSSENDDGEEVHVKSYVFLENGEVVTSLGDETKGTIANTSYEPPTL